MARPLNFAVIGCGMLARSQHIPNLAASGKAALHTCCDLSDEALAECRDRHGARRVTRDYRAAIHDPEVDAVCIATTEKFRLAPIEEAAAAARAGDPSLIFTAEPDKGHAHALDRFVDQINGSGPVVCGVDDAVLATRVAFAAIRSTRDGRRIALEEV